jgi:hypothetical protein
MKEKDYVQCTSARNYEKGQHIFTRPLLTGSLSFVSGFQPSSTTAQAARFKLSNNGIHIVKSHNGCA